MSTPLSRSEFGVTRQYVYLNHAAAGVLPASTVAAIEEFVRAHADGGVLGTFPYDLKMAEYRAKIGGFIGAGGAEIATLANTGAGANTVALGIDWKPGDEVVLCDNEFPANVIPWLGLRRRGVDVRLIPTREERLTPERLQRELSPRTRVVTVSWVSYADGYRHDLAGLAAVAHEAGALLCVDAIQGLGVFPLDVRALGIDALYAGAGKWMLGLHGAAFLYVSPGLGERLAVAMPGWRSLADMWDFHNYEQPFSPEASRFESGTPNLLGALSLVCAIDLFERTGPQAIAEHVLALTDRLCEGLAALDAEFSTLRGRSCSSGIVTFNIPGIDSMALGRALENQKIVTTYRTGGIRVSPHGYNTAQEIDVMLNAVAHHARTKVTV
ncbi:MAG TPA: aminotransferase class V-fold PLP-dependent enzyme [Candidatus Cybelea sp.]|nr:aminotransferase class V-fold PLP-dependent enzyme [Candidatus Cybelea sp.]